VSHWKDLLQKYGAAGLRSTKPPADRGFEREGQKGFAQEVAEGSPSAGFETERWTQARVQQVIEREFGVDLSFELHQPPAARSGLERPEPGGPSHRAATRSSSGLG